MIFLRSPNVIFLKPRKVAGTSFEIALSQFAQPDDVITPISPEDEETRQGLGFSGPRNFTWSFQELGKLDKVRSLFGKEFPDKFFNHISAKQTRDRLGPKIFDQALKVSLVRHPMDRIVSLYYWLLRNGDKHMNISDVLRPHPELIDNNEIYTIDGKEVVDFYIRYEHLLDDISVLEHKVPKLKGLYETFSKLQAKSGIRPKRSTWQDETSGHDELVATVRFFNKTIVQRYYPELMDDSN